jgi:cell division initiation protein
MPQDSFDKILITPLEVTQREFRQRFRGLDPAEVKAHLELVAEEIERLTRENRELTARVKALEEQLAGFQEQDRAIRDAVVSAQRIGESTKEAAKREADQIREEARLQAKKLLERANQEAAHLQVKLAELKAQRQAFLARLRLELQAFLKQIDALEDKDRSAPAQGT